MMNFFKKLFGSKPAVNLEEAKESLERKVSSLRSPAIRLVKTQQITKSKFGGRPFINANEFIWPRSNGIPMVFLAQLDLAELAAVHRFEWLGDCGLLLFFYDVTEMPWGFDPKDRGKWQVLFQTNSNEYAELPDGLDNCWRIEEKYIQPILVQVLPNYDNPKFESLGLSDEEVNIFIEMHDGVSDSCHQVGGFASPVQGDSMDLQSQLASNGVYVGSPAGYKSEKAMRLQAGAANWKLLFQFDSDKDMNVMWGDCGRIYFWVEEQKAKKNEFDNCWLILQCH